MDPCEGLNNPAKAERIVISCVTFETVKVVDPIKHYGATRVHLIYYVKDATDPAYSVYSEFLEEVKSKITEEVGLGVEAIETHSVPVYSFKRMMSEVYRILVEEKELHGDDADILVNVSSGTSEYTAAATIASMMVPDVKPFTVSTKDFFIPTERIRDIYYNDGSPVGMSKAVYPPLPLQTYPIEAPPEDLVQALRVFHERYSDGLPISHVWMVRALIEEGVWREERIGTDDVRKIPVTQSMKMYFIRHYLNKWCERGWVEKVDGKHFLTYAGRNIVEMFSSR